MDCSIVIATRNKAAYLAETLASIVCQKSRFRFEVIIVDDGSTDHTHTVAHDLGCRYIRLENNSYRNPAIARNVGYRAARGKIVISQSDDVIHVGPFVVSWLCETLEPKHFVIATVTNYDAKHGKMLQKYTGASNPRPFFFLGSLYRSDIYAIGGNDEQFVAPGYDDNWFGDCLTRGLGLRPVFSPHIQGLHQDHARPRELAQLVKPSKLLYEQKVRDAEAGNIPWEASGGPWEPIA